MYSEQKPQPLSKPAPANSNPIEIGPRKILDLFPFAFFVKGS